MFAGIVAGAALPSPALAAAPTLTFTDPAHGSVVQAGSAFRLGWTEAPSATTTPIVKRSIAQYAAPSAGGDCPNATYALQWTNTTANPPYRYAAKGLAASTCYYWRVALTDINGVSIAKNSGYVYRPPATDPAIDVTFPLPGAFTDGPTAGTYTLAWTESSSAGIATRTVSEEVAHVGTVRSCTGAAWSAGRTLATDTTSLALTDLTAGNCYRYTITLTDANGAIATAVTGPLLITDTPPPCAYGDVLTTDRGDAAWQTSLVDTTYEVSSTYVPGDLVYTGGIYHMSSSYRIRSIAKADLKAMADAARAAGATIDIQSAFRSYSNQRSTFSSWVAGYGYYLALLASARAGHSEHQLGTSIDFKSYGGSAPWKYYDWATTKAGAWMKANAYKYGWVITYPRGRSPSTTCYKYEPWHYRYYGRALAKQINDSGLTAREWLWRHGSLAPGT